MRRQPERIVTNGKIWTGWNFVEAVGMSNGRVAAIGPFEDVAAQLGNGAVIVDLEGATAVPGLIDSHTHFVRAGLTWNEATRWDGAGGLAEGLARISAAAAATPPGTWIRVVGGWHPGDFTEGRGPTVAELNLAAPDHPVYVQLLYERATLNDAAMAQLPAADPPGGKIERHPDGTPTGTISGPGAFGAMLAQIPLPSRHDRAESTKALAAEYNSLGVVGVIDPGGFGVVPETYGPLFDVWRADALTVRTRLYMVPQGRGSEVADAKEWVRFVQPGFGDAMLRYTGFGEILSFGCHDMEGVRPWSMSAAAKADLREITTVLAEAGWPIHMHAIFDETISDILDVWEPIDASIGLPRTALAHAEPIGPASLRRLKELGTGLAIQDRMIWRMADSAALWGDDIAANAPPLRDILELGIPLGAGTDATVVAEIDPWRCISWLVTGESVDGAPPRAARHRLSIEEALTAYTSGSAWFSLEESARGILEPGMAADIAVLDRDVFVNPGDLEGTRAHLTIVGGRVVHATRGFQGLE